MSTIDLSDQETIAVLSDALSAAGVEGLEITTPAGHLRIVLARGRGYAVSRSTNAPQASAPTFHIKAPLAGRFRPALPVGAPGNEDGTRPVGEGEILGFIAVGPILLPLSTTRSGTLRRVLVDAETLVGFAEPLFELEQSQ